MDLQAAETAYIRDKEKINKKKAWACPCNGCSKAVKQERQRILEELEKLPIRTIDQTSGQGFRIMMREIITETGYWKK